MDNAGKICFGVYPGAVRTLNSAQSYNDGQWHHVVATLGADGMKLFVDGAASRSAADTTIGQAYSGYWRVGGDNLGGWPNQPATQYLAGAIDDVAIYPAPLIRSQGARPLRRLRPHLDRAAGPGGRLRRRRLRGQPDLTGAWARPPARPRPTPGSPASRAPTAVPGLRRADRRAVRRGQHGRRAPSGTQRQRVVEHASRSPRPTVYSEELWFKTSTTQRRQAHRLRRRRRPARRAATTGTSTWRPTAG